jgi:pimeloyl-ACP methyl ester carboxylesterase
MEAGSATNPASIELDIVAVPPRSYGLSTNSRPNQRALLADYRSVVEDVTRQYRELDERDGKQTKIVWYGHSLGASIATCLLSTIASDGSDRRAIPCDALVFENGFASIREMVRTLYPQKFLPYYWLTPFVVDDWNAIGAFHSASTGNDPASLLRTTPKLFVASERDEMVPTEMLKRVYDEAARTNEPGVECTWLGIKDAMHDFAFQKPSWSKGIMGFISRL